MMPLESLSSDQLLQIVELAAREFGTVLVDLPTNWTNWSLSLLARSDLVLLVTELTVAEPAPRAAPARPDPHRRIWTTSTSGSSSIATKRACSRTIRPADVRDALGRDVAFTVANDHAADARRDRPRRSDRRDQAQERAGARISTTSIAGIAAALGLER